MLFSNCCRCNCCRECVRCKPKYETERDDYDHCRKCRCECCERKQPCSCRKNSCECCERKQSCSCCKLLYAYGAYCALCGNKRSNNSCVNNRGCGCDRDKGYDYDDKHKHDCGCGYGGDMNGGHGGYKN